MWPYLDLKKYYNLCRLGLFLVTFLPAFLSASDCADTFSRNLTKDISSNTLETAFVDFIAELEASSFLPLESLSRSSKKKLFSYFKNNSANEISIYRFILQSVRFLARDYKTPRIKNKRSFLASERELTAFTAFLILQEKEKFFQLWGHRNTNWMYIKKSLLVPIDLVLVLMMLKSQVYLPGSKVVKSDLDNISRGMPISRKYYPSEILLKSIKSFVLIYSSYSAAVYLNDNHFPMESLWLSRHEVVERAEPLVREQFKESLGRLPSEEELSAFLKFEGLSKSEILLQIKRDSFKD